jgi:hypothetical protein
MPIHGKLTNGNAGRYCNKDRATAVVPKNAAAATVMIKNRVGMREWESIM